MDSGSVLELWPHVCLGCMVDEFRLRESKWIIRSHKGINALEMQEQKNLPFNRLRMDEQQQTNLVSSNLAINLLETDEQQGRKTGLLGRQKSIKYCTSPRLKEKVERLKVALHELDQRRIQMNCNTYASLLRQCADAKALPEGKRFHAHVLRSGYGRNIFLGNLLVNMYGKCGSPDDARSVFDMIPQRTVVSWTAMIAAYAKNGYSKEALELFQQMDIDGVKPNGITFLSVLDACSSPAFRVQGQGIHANIVESGLETDVVVGTALVNMYGKCGSPDDARTMFEKMPRRNVVSWNAMITAYSQNGCSKEALGLFQQMDLKGMKPNEITFVCVLDACARLAALAEGRNTHAIIVDYGFETNVVVGTALITMYGKCGSLDDARRVFDKLSRQDVVCWNSMIAAYAQNGHGEKAFELFRRMDLEGTKPNAITFICALDACKTLAALEQGREIHASIVRYRFQTDLIVGTALVNMYGKCGSPDGARSMFDKMPRKNVVSWNAMISAYAQNRRGKEALELFRRMDLYGVKPNKITFICTLDACASPAALVQGQGIHANIVDSGFQTDLVVGNVLINMYGKCGSPDHARRVFDMMPCRDVVSWTGMIAAYAQNGLRKEAFELFQWMEHEGVKPNKISFLCVLDACTSPAALTQGYRIHTSIINHGFERDVVVGTALVNMYGKCGSPDDARSMFDKIPGRDVVSWNAMIAAYTQNGHGKEALELFRQMDLEDMRPNKITFTCVLDACASISAIRQGYKIHAIIADNGSETDAVVGSALINMYGKCGSPDDAMSVFNKIHGRDVVSWNAMITAYAQNGHVKEALKLFSQMKVEGVKPDKITFISILCGCSHAGLLDDGWIYLVSMSRDHSISPTAEHHVCMIDLIGRAGQLDEAEDLINNMSFQPDAVAWMAFLGACRIHGEVKRGASAAKHVFELDPNNASPYVLLSNIYAASGRQDDATKERERRWKLEHEEACRP